MLVSEETGALQAIVYMMFMLEMDKECTGSAWAFPIPVT